MTIRIISLISVSSIVLYYNQLLGSPNFIEQYALSILLLWKRYKKNIYILNTFFFFLLFLVFLLHIIAHILFTAIKSEVINIVKITFRYGDFTPAILLFRRGTKAAPLNNRDRGPGITGFQTSNFEYQNSITIVRVPLYFGGGWINLRLRIGNKGIGALHLFN